jgi:CheY-like chemotaxis protein
MRTPTQSHRELDVLIAEDDALTRGSLRRILEAEGYRCAEAASGDEALDIARSSRPRLVLLDVMMPGPDGFHVARHLHADPATRDVRVLFLTARNDPEAVRAARRVAGDMLLVKPIDTNVLLDALSVALYSAKT